MRRLSIAILLLFAIGCANQRYGRKGKKREPVKIVSAEEAAKHDLKAKELEESFTNGTDGTSLMFRFLAKAQKKRAKLMSDVEIEMTTRHKKERRVCRIRVGPEGSLSKEPGNDKAVTRQVTEMRTGCHYEHTPHMVGENNWDHPYLATGTVLNYLVRRCTTYQANDEVTRPESYFEAEFIPPDLDVIEKEHSAQDLELSEPTCEPFEGTVTSSAAVHRIRARIYR